VFFDREYVCLGAGISCTGGSPVATTLNQCYLAGEVTVSGGKGPRKLDAGTHTFRDPAWVHHDGVAYLLPDGGKLVVRADTQKGAWWAINHRYPKDEVAAGVFSCWLDHGSDPSNATYAYVVAPGMPLGSVPAYAADTAVAICRNRPSLQAVRHKRLGATGIAFYEPGSLAVADGLTVGVDQPCLALLRELGGRIGISVSNPENKKLTVGVRIGRKLQGDGVEVLPGKTASRVTFDLPGGMDAGRSVTRTFRIVP
jgi:chondroitin AC lyase